MHNTEAICLQYEPIHSQDINQADGSEYSDAIKWKRPCKFVQRMQEKVYFITIKLQLNTPS